MPRTRSLAWSELKLGVLTIVAVIIASVTIVMLTGSRGFFWQQYTLKTRFPDVAGLKPGSPVRLAGIPVGIVKSWNFVGGDVDVTFGVNREVRRRDHDGVAHQAGIDLDPRRVDGGHHAGDDGHADPEWGYVPAGPPEALLADVTDQASQGIRAARRPAQGHPAREGDRRQARDRRSGVHGIAQDRGDARRAGR